MLDLDNTSTADLVNIKKSGTSRFYITNSGNVGIGTTSPNTKLRIVEPSSTNPPLSIQNSNANGYSGSWFYDSAGTLVGHLGWANGTTTALSNKMYFGTTANKDVVFTTNDTERLRITSTGNVGIGTTSPISELHVVGSARVVTNDSAGGDTLIGAISGVSNGYRILTNTSNEITYSWNTGDNVQAVTINNSGNVGIGTTAPGQKLSINGDVGVMTGILYANDIASYSGAMSVGPIGSSELKLRTSGTEKMRIQPNGYVGIGTTSPGFHLDVNGAIVSRNQMRAPIYYDYNNTAYYTRPSHSDYSGQLKGTLNSENGFSAAIGSVNSTGGVRLTSPGGGSFNSNGNSTGAIKISLPLYQPNKMVNITVEVYDFANYESFTLKCGGYAASNWTNVYAYIMSNGIVNRNLFVRFGHDGVKSCIWIGNTNQTWSHLNVYITDVQVGYQTINAFQWSKGWNISRATSYGTTQQAIGETQMNNWRKLNNNVFLGSQSTRVGIGNTSPGCRLNTNQNIFNSILIRGENPSGQTVGVDGTANLGATHASSFMGSSTTAGLVLANNINTVDAPSPLIVFSARASSNNYNTTYAAIYGVNKGQTTAGTIWNKGCIVLATADTDKVVERMRIDQDGNVGIGIDSPNSTVDINGTAMQQLRLRTPGGPSATSDLSGREGDFAYDDLYLYVKTGSGWGRVALDFAF